MVQFRHISRLPSSSYRLLVPGKPLPPRTVTFRVPLDTNKVQIKHYVEALYGVKVEGVRTLIQNGKEVVRRPMMKRQRYLKKPDWKKAYVKLRDELPGGKIPQIPTK